MRRANWPFAESSSSRRSVTTSRQSHLPQSRSGGARRRQGDTILIRHNGELAIDPVRLDKKGLSDVTIRPARRFRPVLVLGETADAETALFRVHDGKLRLEGLEFRLTAPRRLTMQTVVALVGDGECTLKNCVATLQQPAMPPSTETRLALATLLPVGSAMKLDMPARRPYEGPKLSRECCFIRGDGRFTVDGDPAVRPGDEENADGTVRVAAERRDAALSGGTRGKLPDTGFSPRSDDLHGRPADPPGYREGPQGSGPDDSQRNGLLAAPGRAYQDDDRAGGLRHGGESPDRQADLGGQSERLRHLSGDAGPAA